jgi:hypothetical protein
MHVVGDINSLLLHYFYGWDLTVEVATSIEPKRTENSLTLVVAGYSTSRKKDSTDFYFFPPIHFFGGFDRISGSNNFSILSTLIPPNVFETTEILTRQNLGKNFC